MRDSTKVLIGFSCIWGGFVFFGMLFSALTMGANDPASARSALFLNGLTLFPLGLIAIRHRLTAAYGFLSVSVITAVCFVAAYIPNKRADIAAYTTIGDQVFTIFFVAIPAMFGILLLRQKEAR